MLEKMEATIRVQGLGRNRVNGEADRKEHGT